MLMKLSCITEKNEIDLMYIIFIFILKYKLNEQFPSKHFTLFWKSLF